MIEHGANLDVEITLEIQGILFSDYLLSFFFFFFFFFFFTTKLIFFFFFSGDPQPNQTQPETRPQKFSARDLIQYNLSPKGLNSLKLVTSAEKDQVHEVRKCLAEGVKINFAVNFDFDLI